MKFLRITLGILLVLIGLALAYAGMTIFNQYWLTMLIGAMLFVCGGLLVVSGGKIGEIIGEIVRMWSV